MRKWLSGFISLPQIDAVLNAASMDDWDVHTISPKIVTGTISDRVHVILTRTVVEPAPEDAQVIKEGDILRTRLPRDEASR